MISNFKLIARILQNSLLDWKPISVLPIADLLVVANDADRPSLLGDKYFSPNVDLIAYIAPTVAIGIARILDIKTHPKTLIPVYALSGLFCRALIAKHLHSLFKRLLCLNSHYSFSNAEF
ncbi:hypothetical protein KBY85_12105, partial [Cyanobium sp. BA5m-10]|nr:hypothetical protein [Cyanobium sp. BA5m-10]